jgi:conjugal transfer mating pair stabilization protein TraG
MDYYTYGNLDLTEKMFKSVAMMTGGNSSFDSLMIATSLLAFIILLGFAAFKQSLMPLSSWFFGLMLVWYGMMIPKVDVVIVDQTNVSANRVVSNMPIGLAFMGNISSSLGKWFADKSEVVFTPIGDLTYTKTGLVFGANAYLEASRTNLSNYSPELQSDLSQYMANCSFYDIVKYHKYSVKDLQETDNILNLIGNTNEALPTVVHVNGKTETKFCDQAYVILRDSMTQITQKPNFWQKWAARLNPSGSSSTTNITQATQTMLSGLEQSYSSIFKGIQKEAIDIVTQEMMINAVKTATMQNAANTGNSEQMMAALAGAQAELQTVTANSTSAFMAAKYLPIMHNLIEGIIIALFPIMIVMCVLGGISMFNTVLGYLMSLLWVNLWPGLFAMVNGVANSSQASDSFAKAGGVGGSTLQNSIDMIDIAHSTQALAGHMTWMVVALSGVIVMGFRQGVMGAFSSAGASAQGAASSAGSSVGAGNVSMGNIGYNNTSANKDDRSQAFTEPGVARVTSSDGMTQTTAGVKGSNYITANSNSLPVNASSTYTDSNQNTVGNSKTAQISTATAATSTNAVGATLTGSSGITSTVGKGSSTSDSIGTNKAHSTSSATGYDAQYGHKIDSTTGRGDSSDTSTSTSANTGFGINRSNGTGQGEGTAAQGTAAQAQGTAAQGKDKGTRGSVSASVKTDDTQSMRTSYSRGLSNSEGGSEGNKYSTGTTVSEGGTHSTAVSTGLTDGTAGSDSLTSASTQTSSASIATTKSVGTTDAQTATTQKSNASSNSISVSGSSDVGKAFAQSGVTLGDLVKNNDGAQSKFATAVAQRQEGQVTPSFEGTGYAEVPKTTVSLKNAQSSVGQFYKNSSSDVGAVQAQNSGVVGGAKSVAGLNNVSSEISNQANSAAGAFNNGYSDANSTVTSGGAAVAGSLNAQTTAQNAIRKETSFAQKSNMNVLDLGTDGINFDTRPEFQKAVSGGDAFSGPPTNEGKTQDPKPTGSTVVADQPLNQQTFRRLARPQSRKR